MSDKHEWHKHKDGVWHKKNKPEKITTTSNFYNTPLGIAYKVKQ